MIRIAFLLNFTKEYKGGINYIKNLLFASSLEKRDDIKFYIFLPIDIENEYIDMFSPFATIVKTSVLKRKSIPWFFEKILEKKFNASVLMLNLLKKHKIDIVSHSNFFSKYKKLKIINWIPDFQIIHYPDLWTHAERKRILNQYKNITKHSDRIVLSSNDAFKDYCSYISDAIDKVRVLQFVSQPVIITSKEIDAIFDRIKVQYNIHNDFLYLPNQFWSHKNHITVFKAINILKNRGLNPLLVTTGQIADYRNNNNLTQTLNYIDENSLIDNIRLLGLIPYQEVLVLIKTCLALINPSLFEGWSSTVEEAKSSGKRILLSNIPIHQEQNPNNGLYFDPLDENKLADLIEKVITDGIDVNANLQDDAIKSDLNNRTKQFAEKYHKIIDELMAVS